MRRDESLEYEELIGKYDFTHFGGSTDGSCQSELISGVHEKIESGEVVKKGVINRVALPWRLRWSYLTCRE